MASTWREALAAMRISCKGYRGTPGRRGALHLEAPSLQSQLWLPIAFCLMLTGLSLCLRADCPQALW